MSRYIYAELAKETIREYLKTEAPMPRICKKVMDIAISAVDLTPAADVEEVRHGEWVSTPMANKECSLCHKKYHFAYPFCPSCGAKMDGQKESEDKE